MEQAHGQPLDLQTFAANAVKRDGLCSGDLIDRAVHGSLIDTVENAGKIAKRGVIEAGHWQGS
jgi:hypothetical protein